MKLKQGSRIRLGRLAGLVALGALLTGCSKPGFLISVEAPLSNILFGAKTSASTPAPAPAVPTPPPAPPEALVPPQLFPTDDLPKFPIFAASGVKGVCSNAPFGAGAAVEATAGSDTPPQAGRYKWYSSYTEYNASGRPTNYQVGFEDRLVTNVQQQPDTQATQTGNTIHHWTFDTVQPDPSLNGGTLVISYKVQTYSDLDNNQASITVGANTGAIPTEANVDPDGGVAIHQIQRFDHGGKLIETFAPSTDLLLETLPVVSGGGYNWDFKAVDASHNWTMEISATPGGTRVEVDACGTIVDGWPVDATVTTTKNDASGTPHAQMVQQWHYVVAPQYGGIVILLNISGDTEYGSVGVIGKLGSLVVRSLTAKSS